LERFKIEKKATGAKTVALIRRTLADIVSMIFRTKGRRAIVNNHSIELQCDAQSMTYDFNARQGTLVMGRGSCTDMMGAITFFRRIDPDVTLIRTMDGDKPDVDYRRGSDGRWTAFCQHSGTRGEPIEVEWSDENILCSGERYQQDRRVDEGEYRAFLVGKPSSAEAVA